MFVEGLEVFMKLSNPAVRALAHSRHVNKDQTYTTEEATCMWIVLTRNLLTYGILLWLLFKVREHVILCSLILPSHVPV